MKTEDEDRRHSKKMKTEDTVRRWRQKTQLEDTVRTQKMKLEDTVRRWRQKTQNLEDEDRRRSQKPRSGSQSSMTCSGVNDWTSSVRQILRCSEGRRLAIDYITRPTTDQSNDPASHLISIVSRMIQRKLATHELKWKQRQNAHNNGPWDLLEHKHRFWESKSVRNW